MKMKVVQSLQELRTFCEMTHHCFTEDCVLHVVLQSNSRLDSLELLQYFVLIGGAAAEAVLVVVFLPCPKPRHHVTQVTKFSMVTPNSFGSSVQNLLHVTALTPSILRWLLDFGKCMQPSPKLFEFNAYNCTLVFKDPHQYYLHFCT